MTVLLKKKLPFTNYKLLHLIVTVSLTAALFTGAYFANNKIEKQTTTTYALNNEVNVLLDEIQNIEIELENLKNEDQYRINQELISEIENINKTYKNAVAAYENILKLKEKKVNNQELDKLFAQSLMLLADKNYATASALLKEIDNKIAAEEQKLTETVKIPENIPVKSEPPSTGYTRQTVATDVGNFMVSLVAGDISNTRVIVDTASTEDCFDNCPVLPLADYVSRNGAFAGINGSYFCPTEYPSCAGKTNTFDTLLMNKDKAYFNSSNNVYSNNPAVIFGVSYVRFVTAASQWGRDTGIDGMISNYPLLVHNSGVMFGGDDDPKKGSKSGRSFVANKGNNVYIGVVHNATVGESARVLAAMGMDNALNLDSGGSTALWAGGYKVGPGRNLPNAILFVRK
jgi:hypothetical protein